jgi:hypothetical protein
MTTFMLLCHSCRVADREENSAYCKPCGERKAEEMRQREAFNRGVECPDCHARPGRPCVTGSGVERGTVHVTREKLANRRAKGAA